MLSRSHIHLMWLVQYLTPLPYAAAYYFFHVAPYDQSFIRAIVFLAGAYLGRALLFVDQQWLYPRYNELQTYPPKLITRSVAFIIAYAVLGIFMLTSTDSALGIGLIFGLGISLLAEMVAHVAQPVEFQQRFLYQVQRQFGTNEMRGYTSIFAGLIILFTLLFVVVR